MIISHLNRVVLADQFEIEITFNDAKHVILATGDLTASYKAKNISCVSLVNYSPGLSDVISSIYDSGHVFLFDKVTRCEKISINKGSTELLFNDNPKCASLKGYLFLFKEPITSFANDPEKYFDPEIQTIHVEINGESNQLWSQSLKISEHFNQAKKHFYFSESQKEDHNSYMTNERFLTTGYGLWLDFRFLENIYFHGVGRRFDGVGTSVKITMTKKDLGATTDLIDMYVYRFTDAQINIQERRLHSVLS